MRVYSVLLAVTIAFLANSAAVATNRDEAQVSKLLRRENTERRHLILDLAEDFPGIGENLEEILQSNEHLKHEVPEWCKEIAEQIKDVTQKALETGDLKLSKKDQRANFQKNYLLAQRLIQQKRECEKKE
ncbi:hypothetical protein KXD40_003065 [Peronospora effusa]|uniref:RxLR effector protein n=1 Tax=Peronospora effusa TaxID=542832 RepID=A0A3M6V889_9STRA|nr:hypothetical protein DD238_006850 [Peronospora effusa]RQM18839.1 hypothetical protein DD237_002602 [Peronospora effusa]UIZ29306.1 hypothetical protein KXD40_003065 [Peronospora effusa]CAI5702694.1 unnamed protein product [Peronospora effusa]